MTLRSRTVSAALAALAALTPFSADAVETWVVDGGRTTIHFNADRLAGLGLELTSVQETAQRPAPGRALLEAPYVSFAVSPSSSLELGVNRGVVLADGTTKGGLRHDGGFSLRDAASGTVADFTSFRIDAVSAGELYLSDASGETSFGLAHAGLRLDADTRAVTSSYLELTVSSEWAKRVNRPELAGADIGLVYVEGRARHVSGASTGETPVVGEARGGSLRDVKLGILDGIRRSGRVGSYPNGTVGLSMATTSCNVGDVDVQWFAPMDEDHPSIAMHLYREDVDGHFEQIGTSWLKHGFFALSNSQCTPCQNPSGGDFLGVGCSDTYGAGNNENRRWLGPRDEWDPYAGTWECTGSFFAEYQPDCIRRDNGSGYNGYEHRLEVVDSELDNSGATYYYEAYYVVRDDDNKFNNWGSRLCTMSWTGSSWNFNTPNSGNPLLEGPALYRWGNMHSVTSVGPNDGDFLVAVNVTNLGAGNYRYDYAVLNMDSDREAHEFYVPLDGAVPTNIEYHDWDEDASNDWTASFDAAGITWATDDYQTNPDANALVFGYMFNFRFETNVAPIDTEVGLTMFKPGPDSGNPTALSRGPAPLVATDEPANVTTPARLLAARPNPVTRSTSIPFVVERASTVDIAVFDAAGRRVKSLADDRRVSVGAHEVAWDATDAAGRRVGAGAYYVRLMIDNQLVNSRSVVIVD